MWPDHWPNVVYCKIEENNPQTNEFGYIVVFAVDEHFKGFLHRSDVLGVLLETLLDYGVYGFLEF